MSIANAYEALIDPETRQIYDRYGHEGLEQHKQQSSAGGGRQHHDPFDLFSRFFGGGGHFHRGARRGRDMELRLAVPLRYFYTGRTVSFSIEKQVICDACEGSGSADGEVEECRTCAGRGILLQKHMLAPGIFQQVQSQCGTCGGTGSAIKHPCKACGGSRVRRGKDSYDVHIEPGMATGQRVTFENEADEHPDYVAGDLVVELVEIRPELGMGFEEDDEDVAAGEEKDEKAGDDEENGSDKSNPNPITHSDGTFFRRKDTNLYWREVLSLREAWLGDWSRNLTHLDGHVVRLGRAHGAVVQPGTVEHIAGQGMPVWRVGDNNSDADSDDGASVSKFGDLVVEYVVILPDQMDTKVQNEIRVLWDEWRLKMSDGNGGSGSTGKKPLAHEEL